MVDIFGEGMKVPQGTLPAAEVPTQAKTNRRLRRSPPPLLPLPLLPTPPPTPPPPPSSSPTSLPPPPTPPPPPSSSPTYPPSYPPSYPPYVAIFNPIDQPDPPWAHTYISTLLTHPLHSIKPSPSSTQASAGSGSRH